MKKFVKTLLVALLVLMPVTFASAKKTTTTTQASTAPGVVNIYVFYGDGCPHCADLETYIKTTLRKDEKVKNKFQVVYYEVWNKSNDHSQNIELFNAVGEALGTEPSGVPFFVIGDQYFSGYGESYNSTIVQTILDEASNSKYVDVVGKLVEQMTVKPVESNPEASIDSEENEKKSNTDIVGIIILGVTVVVVLIIIFTKSPEEDEESETVEVKEEKVQPVKAEVEEKPAKAKTTTKKTTSKSTSTKKKTTKKTTNKSTKRK